MVEKELIAWREAELDEAVENLLNKILKGEDCRSLIYNDFYTNQAVSVDSVIEDVKENVIASLAMRYNLNIWRPGFKKNYLTGEVSYTEYPYSEYAKVE